MLEAIPSPPSPPLVFDEVLTDYLETGGLLDAVIAQSHSEAEKFWQIRGEDIGIMIFWLMMRFTKWQNCMIIL